MHVCSIIGLSLDLIGVLFLGIDVIRFQRITRKRANEERTLLDELESEYGGIESWTNEIMEQSEWISESEYSRHHVANEVSYNAQHALDNLRNIASAVTGLAKHFAKVTTILHNNANQDERIAFTSYWFSIVGLIFLIVGFGLQIFGASTLSK